MLFFIILIILVAISLYYVYSKIVNHKYKTFVEEYSVAIKKLREINQRYSFKTIQHFQLEYSYDNENFYNTISTRDYLIYQLLYIKKDVQKAILDADENKVLYSKYLSEIKNNCVPGVYCDNNVPSDKEKLISIENSFLDSLKHKPTTLLSIPVVLNLTNINGVRYGTKQNIFFVEEINEIIRKLNNKSNGYYLNNDIWTAICRVERGKVSNKMRFAIYARDGYRCRKCGRQSDQLEIDHIFPVSKGGKSEFNNLQTLCRMCNLIKSDIVECGAVNPLSEYQGVHETCAQCGAPLVRKNGKYGAFLGCSNYPKCRYTRQIR